MNHVKVKNRVWLALAALLIFWLGDWVGHTYQITGGTTTQKLAAAMNLQVLLAHPMRLSVNAFSLMCGFHRVPPIKISCCYYVKAAQKKSAAACICAYFPI